MKLKTAKKAMWILLAVILLAMFVMAFLPYQWKVPAAVAAFALLIPLAVVSLAFLRCPHCGGRIHLFGMAHCPSCGKKIEE